MAEDSDLVNELSNYLQSVVDDFDSGWHDQQTHFARGYYYAMTLIADLSQVRAALDPKLAQSIDQIREEVEPKTDAPSVVDDLEAMMQAHENPPPQEEEQEPLKIVLPMRNGSNHKDEAAEEAVPVSENGRAYRSLEEQLREKICLRLLELLDRNEGLPLAQKLAEVYSTMFGSYKG